MPRHHSLDIGPDRIAVLTLNHADLGANVLSNDVLSELEQTFSRLKMMKEVSGLLIRSAKPKVFIAGTHVDEIHSTTDLREAHEKSAFGQRVVSLISELSFPSAAAIDGACLGGGLELALACTYRVAADGPHIRLALPEVKLGLIPGFGGTQRLPKIVGFFEAVDLIVTGKILDGAQAFKMGLVDDVTASETLEDLAREWLKKNPFLRRPTRSPIRQQGLFYFGPVRRLVFRIMKVRERIVEEGKGQYPAPLAALDVLEQTFRNSKVNGFEIEARHAAELIVSDVSKALIRLFYATEEIRKEKHGDTPAPVNKVGLVGAGVMGGGLARLISAKGKPVRIRDISPDALNRGMQTVFGLNAKDLKKKRISLREARARNARVSATTDWTGYHWADFVVEAVVENLSVKQEVFHRLSEKVQPGAVLATNTSALSVTEIAKAASHPERVLGLHFFNPMAKVPLVEVVRAEQTSAAAVSTAVAFALSLGKTPIVVADRPGFLVNRIVCMYLSEAARAAEQGVPVGEIEDAMIWFGMPTGPFELMDEVGLDIVEEVLAQLKHGLPYFPGPTQLISAIRADGRLGKKSGKGFYMYDGKTRRLDAAHIAKAIGAAEKTQSGEPEASPFAALSDRFVLLMVNEAFRCLEDGVAASSRDVDVGMVFGAGFAPFRGGLIHYANRRGLSKIVDELERYAGLHGEHFLPVALLREKARSGGTL